MKQITNKTVIKQGDKTFQPVSLRDVIYWVDETQVRFPDCLYFGQGFNGINYFRWHDSQHKEFPNHKGVIVAQSSPVHPRLPVIDLHWHITLQLALDNGYDWYNTESSARRVFELWAKQIIEQINSIQTIEVDNEFNIISFA